VVLGLQDLAPVDQRVLKYSQAALAKAEAAPPPQVAEQAIADLMRRTNENVGFGKSSVKQGAQAFVEQGNALMRRA
jgi:multiple sugar transport system substrate-binding protein